MTRLSSVELRTTVLGLVVDPIALTVRRIDEILEGMPPFHEDHDALVAEKNNLLDSKRRIEVIIERRGLPQY